MWRLNFDHQTGQLLGASFRLDDFEKCVVVDGAGWNEFVKENAAAENPLELKDIAPPPKSADERRRAEYEKQGITVEALTVALWEKLVEGRTENADELQRKREAIKEQFPAQIAQTVKG